jgi:hypothetical protein
MKKWILALALLCLAVPGLAEEKTALTAYNLNMSTALLGNEVTAPDLVYCRTIGVGEDPYGADFSRDGSFDLQGNTLTDLNGANTFQQLLPGDIIKLRAEDRIGGTTGTETIWTTVIGWVDDNNVQVGPGIVAADVQHAKVYYRITQCSDGLEQRRFPSPTPGEYGTSTGGAWVNVLNWESITFTVAYQSGDIPSGLGFAFECRVRANSQAEDPNKPTWGVQVYPGASSTCGFGTLATDICTLTTPEAGAPPGRAVDSKFSLQVAHTQNFYECRIGLTCPDVDCGTQSVVQTSITVNRQEVK